MTETDNSDVQTEVVAPAVEESPQAVPLGIEEPSQEQTGQSDKEMNFAALRDKQNELERKIAERDQLIEALHGQMQQAQPQKQAEPEVDELDNLAPDEWLTKEQSARLAKRQAQLAVEKALAEDRQRRAQEELPEKIKRDYPDFDQVVSKENVEYLKANKPHLAQALAATQDPLAQAKAAYDAIKAYCPSAQVTQDKQRAEKNATRPGTLDAAGPPRTADFDPKRLNADTKAQLWKEMQEAARG